MSVTDKQTETQCHGMGSEDSPNPSTREIQHGGDLKRGTKPTWQNKNEDISQHKPVSQTGARNRAGEQDVCD